jgi:SAM-dependent methyltransferase
MTFPRQALLKRWPSAAGSRRTARSPAGCWQGALDLATSGSVIDIGGGPGTVLVGLRRRWPQLKATLMELPAVAAAAPQILAEYGATYVEVEAGDILEAPSRGRHDLAILKAVIQVLPADQARRTILNAARCLNPGGQIAVAGWGVVDDDRMGPREGVFLNLTFLNLYRSGESYTEGEYCAWMTEAGFQDIRRSRLDDGCALFTGRLKS